MSVYETCPKCGNNLVAAHGTYQMPCQPREMKKSTSLSPDVVVTKDSSLSADRIRFQIITRVREIEQRFIAQANGFRQDGDVETHGSRLQDAHTAAYIADQIERLPLNCPSSDVEGADCQIAKVIPVGHGGACQYSVAIGSLGIKLFESLTDAQEVRDAINKAIVAAVSQGGVARSVPAETESELDTVLSLLIAYGLIHTIDGVTYPDGTHEEAIKRAQVLQRQIRARPHSGSSVDTDEIAAIRELRRKMYFPSGRSTGEWAHVDTLLAAYDALKGENEKWQRAAGYWKATSEVASAELSRLKAADEVKEQDNES